MRPSGFHYFPLHYSFLIGLGLVLLIVIVLIELRVLRYASERIGIPPRYALGLLLLCLVGSYVNVPIAELPPEPMVSEREVTVYGVRYIIPEVEHGQRTVIAVNVGGAVIPTLLSLYLLVKNRLYLPGLIAVFLVAVIVHFLAHPVKGVGIVVPTFVPAITTAIVAVLISLAAGMIAERPSVEEVSLMPAYRRIAAPLAYIAGTLGTLIGADLANLHLVQGLGAPVVSIGGAGTFDGVFLTGILAVLLA